MTDIEKQISATKLAIQLCDKLGIDYTYGDRGCTLNGEPVPDAGLLFPVKIFYKGYTTTPELMVSKIWLTITQKPLTASGKRSLTALMNTSHFAKRSGKNRMPQTKKSERRI